MTHPCIRILRDERGMALAIALLVLLVISLLATVLMVSVNVESKITSHGVRESRALDYAEAGISEAQARIANLDVSLDENPRAVAQIFNTLAGDVPVLGTDSIGLPTAQPAGEWLPYSTAVAGPNVLTVEYKTNATRTAICRYDAMRNPAVQTISGEPIYVITSTGVTGGDVRRVRAEVYPRPVPTTIMGAVASNAIIQLKGNIDICGYNHSVSMPSREEDHVPYHLGYGDMPGTWCTDDVQNWGAATSEGVPDLLEFQTGPFTGDEGFYDGPWDVFSMTEAEFYDWVGTPLLSVPWPPIGLVYVDGDATLSNWEGEGFLYVSGDLTVNGTFCYRGLVYIGGDLRLQGESWILGGLVVRGNTVVDLTVGNPAVFYSAEAIARALSNSTGDFVRLSWREVF